MTTTVRVEGIQQTIKTLKEIDPELRKEFNRNVKAITKPIVQTAQATYRSQSFPSGTARRWAPGGRQIFPLTTQLAVRGVTTKISTSKRSASTITVVQSNAGAAVFEFARNGSLGAAFTSKNGYPARVMWPSADRNAEQVKQAMAVLVDDVTETVNRRLY